MKCDIQHSDTQDNAEHCYAECPVMLSALYAQSHIQALYAECRYAECHYAECRSASLIRS
jgi:hypothetical protein